MSLSQLSGWVLGVLVPTAQLNGLPTAQLNGLPTPPRIVHPTPHARRPQDGTLLATGGDDGLIALIELSTFTLVASWVLEEYVYRVTFSPKGNLLVSSCRNGLVRYQ